MGKYILTEIKKPISLSPEIQVVTSSKAIARSLKVPQYSLESLTQNIVRRQGWGIASTLLSRRLLQNAVREIIDPQDVSGTARAFFATIKDLFRSGVNLTKLQQNSAPRIQQISSLAIAYQQQLRQRNLIDGAELYWQGSLAVNYQKTYLFWGYFAPRKDELAVINAIAGQSSILLLPVNDLVAQNYQALEWLQSQGWELQTSKPAANTGIARQLQQCWKKKAVLPQGVSLNIYPNLQAEVRGVLTQVKELLTQGVKAEDIVLITQEEQLYGEALIDIAWEFNLPLKPTYEIPLEQTRLGGWLKLLLEVIRDRFPFEATAKLLAHPLAKVISAELWEKARQIHPQGLQAWQKLGVDLSLLNFSQPSYSRQDWLQRLQEILFSWDLLEQGKIWARETLAFYSLQEILEELARLPGDKLSKAAFINEINEILALVTVPVHPGRGGIELHQPTSLLGTNYPYVFVLGCGEGILPTAIADDSILDFHSRKKLVKQGFNLETAIDIAQREAFYFFCMLGIPSQNITFSYPELIERQAILPSPYLTRLEIKSSPVKTLPLASIELTRQAYLRQAHLLKQTTSSSLLIPQITRAWQVETNRENAIAPDEYDGVIGIEINPDSKIFSASQLTQLGQCPFKWFSARLLKLKKLSEAESDLSAAIRGNLYHRCLELSLAEIKTAQDLVQFNQEQLKKIFNIAEKELNLTQLPGWNIQRQEHLDLLSFNLTNAEFLPPDREVLAREIEFATQWYGLQVKGQVDRIDRTPTGLTLIDYKTSGVTPAGVKDLTGKAKIDIQLALYQDAIAEKYPAETVNSTAYYSLTQQKTISRPQKDPTELAAFAAKVRSHLQQGHYPVSPDLDRKACQYCHYDLVCRQGDRLMRK